MKHGLIYRIMVGKILGFFAESIGWVCGKVVPKKFKQKIYHKFDNLFDELVLKSICNGADSLEEIERDINVPLFIIKDSVERLKSKKLIEITDDVKILSTIYLN